MINYYQPFLWSFLCWRRSFIPQGIKQSYWLSFEDALWELLPQRGVPQGSCILLPDFYCMDVVENIRSHGYEVALYPLNEHFQHAETVFKKTVAKLRPKVVILFHAAGLQSQLVTPEMIHWLGQQNCLVIEDCVHRLIDPSTVQLFGKHHIVMDSLRKVSPLSGSMVYQQLDVSELQYHPVLGNTAKHTQSIKKQLAELLYQYQASALFIVFQVAQLFAVVVQSSYLMRYAHQVLLKRHDDLVGDSQHGYTGWRIWQWLHSFIDFEKIASIKQQQVQQYQSLFQQFYSERNSVFYQVVIPKSDEPRLHVYPLGLRRLIEPDQLDWLHRHGLVVWPKFPDSPWAKNRGVLFLPLGPHVSNSEIQRAVALVQQACTQV